MRTIVLLLTALCVAVATPLAPATAAPKPAGDSGALLARAGGGSAGFGRAARGFSRPRYGYRRPSGYGRGFAHGLFTGWAVSHLLGYGLGFGFPLWPLWLLLLFVVLRPRRRNRR